MSIIKRALHHVHKLNPGSLLKKILRPRGVFQERYNLESSPSVTLYTNTPEQFPGYQEVRPLDEPGRDGRAAISLIATVRNESQIAAQWVAALLSGSLLPEEIILVDAGSEDGTSEILQSAATQSPVPIKVIVEPGVNIAQGRNLAIESAEHDLIAVTDFGALPDQDWLQKLVYPFVDDPGVQVVAGWYEAVDSTGNRLKRRSWPAIEMVKPARFIPSSRSIAFRKDRWKAVGGYPEWLSLTGEDTYFALELRQVSDHWAFVPDAVVRWQAPESLPEYWEKQYAWSAGDGESGINAKYYWLLALRWGFTAASLSLIVLLLILGIALSSWWYTGIAAGLLLLGMLYIVWQAYRRNIPVLETFTESAAQVAQLLGFLRGARNRPTVDQRRLRTLAGCFFILSGVPIDDTGGGARCTQIALELLRRQHLVVFINRYPKYESEELGIQIHHPNLITSPIQKFDLDHFIENTPPSIWKKPPAVLIEFPLDDFLPLVKRLKDRGCTVVYDLLDEWDTSLGSTWYTRKTEQEIITLSDQLVATAPGLKSRLQELSGRPVHLLPNAVNLHIFNAASSHPIPDDYPAGKRSAIYTGALWGDWFDWELLIDICDQYPELNVVMVGDYRGQSPEHPPNLYFLGLKPQWSLPAYLAHADVAFIPWKINQITKATSPLKVYEYLAMGKPVVAPDLPPLNGIPYVLRSKTRQEFSSNILEALTLQIDPAEIDRFVSQNSWKARLDQLLPLVEYRKTADLSPKIPPGE